jgi:DNA-binding transcriptional LysR family regulator
MSQPATSSALERCRRLLDDPLLERVGSTMRLTAKAEALRQPLAKIMADIGKLVAIDAPLLKDVRQTVHIVMADALATLLAPTLYAGVSGQAPGIELVLHPWGGGEQAIQQLARGTVDLAVSVLPETVGPEFHTEVVDTEGYKVVMRRDHPAALCFDLDRWLSWPHIIVSSGGSTRTPVDDALAALGHKRRIGMVVPSFLLVPAMIQRSDMIALLPTVALDDPAELGLVTFTPPLPLDGFTLSLAWHRRRSQDLAVQFVASSVRTLI